MARKYRVDITRTAERDIETIYGFIARDNPASAVAWLDTVERNIASLEQWPQQRPIIPEASELAVEYRHLIGAQLLDLDILER